MLEFEQIVRNAALAAGGERAAIAAPYDLPDPICRELVSQGVFAGYVANSAPKPADRDPRIAGWWIDRSQGRWFLRDSIASTLVVLGDAAHQEIAPDLLAEAHRKRIARLLVADAAGSILREIGLSGIASRRSTIAESARPVGALCYERVFDEIFGRVGNRLRLPLESFDPARVLLIIGHLGPGGAERQAAYTAAGLARRRAHDVHIGCHLVEPPPAGLFRPMVEAAGAKVSTVEASPPEYDRHDMAAARSRLAAYDSLGIGNIFYAVLQYASLIRQVRPALVHTWMDYCNVLAGIAAELVGVPALVLSGRSVAPDNFPLLFQPYMRAGYMSLFRRRDLVFLNNSRAGAVDYARWLDLPEEQFEVVHNGFEFPAEVSRAAGRAVRAAHGIDEDAPVVGSITRFTEEKRPEMFLHTARVLHSRDPRLRFLVFGTGPMLDEMREWVEVHGLTGIVILAGLTEDAWGALAAMDLFMLTSRMEGFPNVLVEAQASGVPVVCTGVGGMEETFIDGETGIAVRGATAETLADAVSALIGNPARLARMSARASEHARTAFGIDRMLDRTLQCYGNARSSGSYCHEGAGSGALETPRHA